MRILLVEDDAGVGEHVTHGLRAAGHNVVHVTDGREGLLVAAGTNLDVIVLDRMLPGIDGLTILKTLRAARIRTPLLILSARGDVDERVEGLLAGSDDYLAKPFAMSELVARVEVLGKRPSSAEVSTRFVAGDIEMDLSARTVRRAGARVVLTDREFRILEFLIRNADRVVTRSMLLEQVWDYHFDPQTNIIDQHMSRLRQKLETGGTEPVIETVRGAGYVIRSRANR
jgi:two-component system, OmpR family, response regulator